MSSEVLKNIKIITYFIFFFFVRIGLQTLVVVPGRHAMLFGVIGGIIFGWIAAKSAKQQLWEKLGFATLGALYSLAAAIIGSWINLRFSSSIAVGIAWTSLELQAKYNERIFYLDADNIRLSLNAILSTLIGALPFVGYALFDLVRTTTSSLQKTPNVEPVRKSRNSSQ